MIISEDNRLQFAGLYLLRLVRADSQDAARILREGEKMLEPILEWLVRRQYASVTDSGQLKLTSAGAAVAMDFERRYQRFVERYDVFCAVDLETGGFAFEAYDDFSEREQWEEYLEQECFDDLRVAVAQFEGLDPVELIFMSFVQEGRFGYTEEGWEEELLLGSVWDDIAEACGEAVQLSELAYEGDDGPVTAESVARDVLARGQEVMQEIRH